MFADAAALWWESLGTDSHMMSDLARPGASFAVSYEAAMNRESPGTVSYPATEPPRHVAWCFAVFAKTAMNWESGIGSDLATEPPCHVACFAVFAEAPMNWDLVIGSDLATEPPPHVACFAVFHEAAVGWESGTSLHLTNEPPESGTCLHLATEPPIW